MSSMRKGILNIYYRIASEELLVEYGDAKLAKLLLPVELSNLLLTSQLLPRPQ